MRNLVLFVLLTALSASAALADPVSRPKPDYITPPGKILPRKGANAGTSCAAYGAGFVKVEGSDTCVKLGGAISIGVDAGSAPR